MLRHDQPNSQIYGAAFKPALFPGALHWGGGTVAYEGECAEIGRRRRNHL